MLVHTADGRRLMLVVAVVVTLPQQHFHPSRYFGTIGPVQRLFVPSRICTLKGFQWRKEFCLKTSLKAGTKTFWRRSWSSWRDLLWTEKTGKVLCFVWVHEFPDYFFYSLTKVVHPFVMHCLKNSKGCQETLYLALCWQPPTVNSLVSARKFNLDPPHVWNETKATRLWDGFRWLNQQLAVERHQCQTDSVQTHRIGGKHFAYFWSLSLGWNTISVPDFPLSYLLTLLIGWAMALGSVVLSDFWSAAVVGMGPPITTDAAVILLSHPWRQRHFHTEPTLQLLDSSFTDVVAVSVMSDCDIRASGHETKVFVAVFNIMLPANSAEDTDARLPWWRWKNLFPVGWPILFLFAE